MKTLTKLSIAAAALMLTVTTASASTVGTSYSGTITDNYIGKGYQEKLSYSTPDGDIIGDHPVAPADNYYNIFSLDYTKTGNLLVVRINTNFYKKTGGYDYGDLFISTKPKPMSLVTSQKDVTNNWEYVFNMTNNSSVKSEGTGVLETYDINNKIDASARNGFAGPLDTKQAIRVHDGGAQYETGGWTQGDGFIEYTFSLVGTNLVGAEALAFRWGMSCGNDIIQGHTTGNPGNGGPDVAEPATLGLLGLGLIGFGLVRRRRVA